LGVVLTTPPHKIKVLWNLYSSFEGNRSPQRGAVLRLVVVVVVVVAIFMPNLLYPRGGGEEPLAPNG
jgi:hypothetical protein